MSKENETRKQGREREKRKRKKHKAGWRVWIEKSEQVTVNRLADTGKVRKSENGREKEGEKEVGEKLFKIHIYLIY